GAGLERLEGRLGRGFILRRQRNKDGKKDHGRLPLQVERLARTIYAGRGLSIGSFLKMRSGGLEGEMGGCRTPLPSVSGGPSSPHGDDGKGIPDAFLAFASPDQGL